MPRERRDVLKTEQRIYTVSELTQDIKLVLDNTFTNVVVEGEVSGISRIATGTTFFTLKDERAQLKCVIFFGTAGELKFQLKDGLKVICFGRISVYEKSGAYQLYVDKVEPKGIGALQLALEQLKKKLEKEGLFDPGRKRPLPYLPSRIGIVTSPTGAAIKDILKVLDRRFKDVEVMISPVRVQGEGSKEDIARAIHDCNEFNQASPAPERIEVLILARGGGSIEDLWSFNEEIVARAIYGSKIPIISAVGHERDWTIADLVADVRAATPSVAAEMALPEKEDLRQEIDDLALRLGIKIKHLIDLYGTYIGQALRKIELLSPQSQLKRCRENLENLIRRISTNISHNLVMKEADFKGEIEKLNNLNPLNILSRGYSVTFKMPEGVLVKDAGTIAARDQIKTRLHKGVVISEVKEVNAND